MIPDHPRGAPADKYPAGRPGPQASRSVDNRTELDKLAAENRANFVEDETDNEPKVEPIPEVPGLFKFTTPIRSAKSVNLLNEVTLRPATARSLMAHGEIVVMETSSTRDPATGAITKSSKVAINFEILGKHVADMSGLSIIEVGSISGFDMIRLKDKVYSMMYELGK